MSEQSVNVGNKLLAALPKAEYERLLPHLEPITLPFKKILFLANEPIEYVYFIYTGASSMLMTLEGGGVIEVATVGNEGMLGTPVLLGGDQLPVETIMQIPGAGVRMKAEVFKREVFPGSVTHNLLMRYIQALMNQAMQTAACNRLHSVEERCSRWLLMTRDRVQSDEFPLTQEFLSDMLGVRRATVSVTASVLQKAGLISYHRGMMKIIDCQGLESASCECYRVLNQEYKRLLESPFRVR